ncbi:MULTISPECIES: DUF6059 family protein [unclassified Streptomyces]|uniref:DUF6059 family protein n=1 Tax=unclassified Streptomyces TaxID=2593676 RepID=UPI0022527599|nr:MULTISPECIES: DUF6059 family protein [unclassified Streptomyces]MCX4884523.1 hypothetical protein [Streptomyces sp. NBC_00847]MCX5424667.1 hypothetical protein [Streptomyces sp. NBC_00078]
MRTTRTVRVLKAIYGALVAAGRMYVCIPAADLIPTPADVPPWHPERLRPDVPLTECERALEQQLAPGRQVA